MTMPSSISVVIPVYNGARFIRHTLASVCAQTRLPAEIVIADDCSSDGTGELAAEFAITAPVPIRVFRLPQNTGSPFGPANLAVRQTTGRYVYILDADDLLVPDAFESYLRMFEAGPEDLGLVTSDFLTFDDKTSEVITPSYFARWGGLMRRVLDADDPAGVLLEQDEPIRILSAAFVLPFKGLVTRSAWDQLGGCNLEYRYAGDCEFIWRYFADTRLRARVLNRPLVRVRMVAGSLSSTKLTDSGEMVRLFRTMIRGVGEPELRTVLRRRLDKELFDLAYSAYRRRAFRRLVPAARDLALSRLRRLVLPSTTAAAPRSRQ